MAGKTDQLHKLENPVQTQSFESNIGARPTAAPRNGRETKHSRWSEDCFYYCLERNNVVVLFGTLKVQSFILTEVRGCDLLIVVTSSTFLKRKDMLKEKNS